MIKKRTIYVRMKITLLSSPVVSIVCLCVVGCGGGGSNGSSSSPGGGGQSTTPSFTVSLSPANLSLEEGTTSNPIQISLSPKGGFDGMVSLTISGLPKGVTSTPSSLSGTPGTPLSFTLSAAAEAPITQQSVTIQGTSGNLTANASLQLTLGAAPVPDPFHLIGGIVVHGFYDETRQLLFVTNPGLNELDVLSGQDLSIKARVPVPQPWGIDQMADGNTLVIGTAAQEILTVNEDTLAVTQHPYSAIGDYFFALFFPNVVAMANGKVFMIGQEQGIDSDDILDGGQYVYVWDSNTDTFSLYYSSNESITIDSLTRSADHNWAAFSSDQFYLYSSASDTLASASLTAVDPPAGEFGVRGYAINSNGTEIAVASANQVTFLNQSLSVLSTAPIPGAFQQGRTSVQFSPDSGTLYIQYDLPLVILEINAQTYASLGYQSGVVTPENNEERLLTTDSSGRGFVGIAGGVRVVNLGTPDTTPLTANGDFVLPYCPLPVTVLPLNSPAQVQFGSPAPGYNIYVGGQPAPLLSGGTGATIPASTTPSAVDVQCVDTADDSLVIAQGVSYGLTPVGLSANLLPPTADPSVYLFGFGFTPIQSTAQPPPPLTVTIAGQPANSVNAPGGNPASTYQSATVVVSKGNAGETAAISVNGSLGSGTLPAAASYASNPTILTASGLLQLLFDTHRNLLYALKATEVDVLNPATLKWQSPLAFPSSATGSFNFMALSPDGSKLVVAGSAGSAPQFIVLDPDNVAAPSVITYSGQTTVSVSGSIAISSSNAVIIPGDPGLVLNLSTSTFTPLPYFGGSVVKASADGSQIFSTVLNSSNGLVASINPSTYAVQTNQFGEFFWTDLAVSPDGTQFATIYAPPAATGDGIGFFDADLHYLNTNVYPPTSPPDDTGVLGATFSPGGKVLVMPLGDSIEFWNASTGTLLGRLMTPEELQVVNYAMDVQAAPALALDSAGQTIFALSASGLSVLPLPQTLDQMSPAPWPPLIVNSNVRPAAYGSLSSRVANLRKAQKTVRP
jgi:hypothetical protein